MVQDLLVLDNEKDIKDLSSGFVVKWECLYLRKNQKTLQGF
jgi:hypothetical protein